MIRGIVGRRDRGMRRLLCRTKNGKNSIYTEKCEKNPPICTEKCGERRKVGQRVPECHCGPSRQDAAALAPSPPAAPRSGAQSWAGGGARVAQASLRPREALCPLLRVSVSHSPPGRPLSPNPSCALQNTPEPPPPATPRREGVGPPRTPGFLERAHVTSPCAINSACCWAEFGGAGPGHPG